MKNPLARWIGVGALGAVIFGAAGLSSAKADDCYRDRYRDRSDYRIEFRYDSRDRRGSHYYLDYDRYDGRRYDYRYRDRDCDDRSYYRRHDRRRCD